RPAMPNGPTEGERTNGTEESARRGRRGRGRGRGRDRAGQPPSAPRDAQPAEPNAGPVAAAAPAPEMTGERLTRDEALDLVQRAVQHTGASAAEPVPAAAARRAARELLGRDSESLNERFFHRILRDAHDAERIDLRLQGEDYVVAPALARAASAAPAQPAAGDANTDPSQAQRSAANAASLRRGMRHRGLRTSRPGELPPDLLSVGVVGATSPTPEPEAAVEEFAPEEAPTPAEPETAAAPRRPRGRRGGKSAARPRTSKATAAVAETGDA